MRRINYNSDIPPLLLSLNVDENQITVPDCDFIVRFYIEGYEGRHYDCSHIGGVWSNCEPSEDGTKLVCYINNQRLGIGELCAEFHYISPDRRYSDGSQKSVVIIDSTELGVELVEDNGDAVTEAAIDVTLPFIYRTAYEIARDHGYTGTAEDFYSALASVVGIAEAEAGRVSSEELREANEQQRVREFDAMKEIVDELEGKVDGVVEDEKSFEDAIRDQVNNYKPIVIEGNVTNAADEEDITSENGLLKLKNRSALNGIGYVILRQNKDFAEQVIKTNTVYEIRYDFNLDGKEITVPENCTLRFTGGNLNNGTINLRDTYIESPLYCIFNCNIKGTVKNEYIEAEWVGCIGDNVTDNTLFFKRCEGFNTKLNKGYYKASNILVTGKRNIIGISRGASVLVQMDNSIGDFIVLQNWYESLFENLTIIGGKNITKINYQQALLKLKTTADNINYSFRSIINNILIKSSEFNGLSILGKGDFDDGIACDYNWVFTVNNLAIQSCGEYCLYNRSSDNLFSNINLNNGKLANMLDLGSSNMYTNMKLDGECCGEVLSQYTLDNYLDKPVGASLIVMGSLNFYINCDIQSSQLQGLKIINANRIHFIGNINNCGLYFENYINNNDLDYKEAWDKVPAIYVKNLTYSIINCMLSPFSIENQLNDFNYSGYCFGNVFTIIKNNMYNITDYFNSKLYDLRFGNKIIGYCDTFIKQNKKTIKSLIDKDLEDTSWYAASEISTEKIFGKRAFVSAIDKSFNLVKGIEVKQGNVYLGIAICKCIKKGEESPDIYAPYFNVVKGSGEDTILGTTFKYFVRFPFSKKVYDKCIKEGHLFYIYCLYVPEETTFAFTRIFNVDNGTYIINNVRTYNLTESLGITNIFADESISDNAANKPIIDNFIYNTDIQQIEKPFNSLDYINNENCMPNNNIAIGKSNQRTDNAKIGSLFYDTTLKKYIVWNGTEWTNIDGTDLI